MCATAFPADGLNMADAPRDWLADLRLAKGRVTALQVELWVAEREVEYLKGRLRADLLARLARIGATMCSDRTGMRGNIFSRRWIRILRDPVCPRKGRDRPKAYACDRILPCRSSPVDTSSLPKVS